jgi:hypothetical protein
MSYRQIAQAASSPDRHRDVPAIARTPKSAGLCGDAHEGGFQTTRMPAKSLLESYLDDESDAAQQPMSRSIWRIALLARERGRNFWNCAPASGPTHPITVRPLASASAFWLPCARRIHKAPGEPPHWRWMAIAARHPAGGFGCMEIAPFRSRTSSPDLVAQDVLSNHVRSLMGAHLLGVPSSDQHMVKPWFNGKPDFSPMRPRL